jgi:hypothetical protein
MRAAAVTTVPVVVMHTISGYPYAGSTPFPQLLDVSSMPFRRSIDAIT